MIKRILPLLAALILLASSAAPLYAAAADTPSVYYFDSVSGSDTASGTSEANAFRSASKLSSLKLLPGDSVLFKCGCTFTDAVSFTANGTQEKHITVGSYGSGAAPILTTDKASIVVEAVDSSWLDIKGLEITAPADGGRGLFITSRTADSHDITVSGMKFHDISNNNMEKYACAGKGCLMLVNEKKDSNVCVHDITVSSCEFYDCSYGMSSDGVIDNDTSKGMIRNHDILVTGCSFHDIWDDAVIIFGLDRFTLTDSSVIMTCISTAYYTAPVWMAHADSCVVSDCEVAGSLNYMDGMTVDFDELTSNSTYERIYSHDNARFLWAVARQDGNTDNTVRYCLSINDSVTTNGAYRPGGTSYTIDNVKFYNNTIMDGTLFDFSLYKNAVVANNIFWLYDNMYVKARTDTTMTDNVYYGNNVMFPGSPEWQGNRYCNPFFANEDDRDTKNGFMLLRGSSCLGAGTQVEKDMGKSDLWGNPLGDTHNIGCYEGGGVTSASNQMTGDVNGNETIGPDDAREALRIALGMEDPDYMHMSAADADRDGKVTAQDARLILRAAVGLQEL